MHSHVWGSHRVKFDDDNFNCFGGIAYEGHTHGRTYGQTDRQTSSILNFVRLWKQVRRSTAGESPAPETNGKIWRWTPGESPIPDTSTTVALAAKVTDDDSRELKLNSKIWRLTARWWQCSSWNQGQNMETDIIGESGSDQLLKTTAKYGHEMRTACEKSPVPETNGKIWIWTAAGGVPILKQTTRYIPYWQLVESKSANQRQNIQYWQLVESTSSNNGEIFDTAWHLVESRSSNKL